MTCLEDEHSIVPPSYGHTPAPLVVLRRATKGLSVIKLKAPPDRLPPSLILILPTCGG